MAQIICELHTKSDGMTDVYRFFSHNNCNTAEIRILPESVCKYRRGWGSMLTAIRMPASLRHAVTEVTISSRSFPP